MSVKQATIGLINPKNPLNVASVLRAAGCYKAAGVVYTGVRYDRAKEYYADTKAMHKIIPTSAVVDLQQSVPVGAKSVVIELVEGAVPLPDYNHPERAFYIFGPEDGSVPPDVLNWADEVVYIPTTGCMNLAATVNVVLYDRMAKSNYEQGDHIIRQSRDQNNQRKVR